MTVILCFGTAFKFDGLKETGGVPKPGTHKTGNTPTVKLLIKKTGRYSCEFPLWLQLLFLSQVRRGDRRLVEEAFRGYHDNCGPRTQLGLGIGPSQLRSSDSSSIPTITLTPSTKLLTPTACSLNMKPGPIPNSNLIQLILSIDLIQLILSINLIHTLLSHQIHTSRIPYVYVMSNFLLWPIPGPYMSRVRRL